MRCLEAVITLRGIEPEVSRTLKIPLEKTFHEFHNLIQLVFSWQNTHLYKFTVRNPEVEIISDRDVYSKYRETYLTGEKEFSESVDLREAFTPDTRLSYDTSLGDVISELSSVVYTYDMGDSWTHDIRIAGFSECRGEKLLGATGITPPEDSGGAAGYSKIKDALFNPDHKNNRILWEWARDKGYTGKEPDLAELNEIISSGTLTEEYKLEDNH